MGVVNQLSDSYGAPPIVLIFVLTCFCSSDVYSNVWSPVNVHVACKIHIHEEALHPIERGIGRLADTMPFYDPLGICVLQT